MRPCRRIPQGPLISSHFAVAQTHCDVGCGTEPQLVVKVQIPPLLGLEAAAPFLQCSHDRCPPVELTKSGRQR